MKRLFSITLFILVFMSLARSAISAPLEAKGLLVYHDPSVPRFIEVITYNQNSTKNVFDGELVTVAGTRRTYNLHGVIAQIDYPADANQVTVELVNDRLKMLNTLLINYPKEKDKFQHALTAWQEALVNANNRIKNEKEIAQSKSTAPAATSVNAEDITTTTGKKYSNVTISRIDPSGITIMTDSGIQRIPFAELPEEFRTKYGYDPQKAAQFMQAEQAAQMQRVAAQQKIIDLQSQQQQQDEKTSQNKAESIRRAEEKERKAREKYIPDPPVSGMQRIGGG